MLGFLMKGMDRFHSFIQKLTTPALLSISIANPYATSEAVGNAVAMAINP